MRRRLLAATLALLLAGCIDTSAVSRFAQTAPDPAKLDALTDAYAAVPAAEVEWDIYSRLDSPTRQLLVQQTVLRKQQQADIARLNGLLVAYMRALGGLANPKLTDVSVSTTTIANGLSRLKTADPALRISDTEITGVSALTSLVAEAAVQTWRERELERVIGQAQQPFQALVSVELKIVRRGIIPDLENLKSEIRGTSDAAKRALQQAHKDVAPVAAFTLNRAAEHDLARYDLEERAAKAYVQALEALAAAHTKLYEERHQFSKATLQTILPLLQQIEVAYDDLRKL